MRVLVVCTSAILLMFAVVGCDEETDQTQAPTATEEEATATEEPTATVEAATATEARSPTDTPIPEPTQPQVTNRQNCGAISGTAYLSEEERQWFQGNCVVQQPVQPPVGQQPPAQQPPPQQACHPSYVGACLNPNASDYDCSGGSGNGPYYTGPVTVVGPDKFDLDRDGDGFGCE